MLQVLVWMHADGCCRIGVKAMIEKVGFHATLMMNLTFSQLIIIDRMARTEKQRFFP